MVDAGELKAALPPTFSEITFTYRGLEVVCSATRHRQGNSHTREQSTRSHVVLLLLPDVRGIAGLRESAAHLATLSAAPRRDGLNILQSTQHLHNDLWRSDASRSNYHTKWLLREAHLLSTKKKYRECQSGRSLARECVSIINSNGTTCLHGGILESPGELGANV